MKGKCFIDTNLLVYAISTDADKANKIELLFRESFDFLISTQVVNEFINTCHRKNLLPVNDIRSVVEDFLSFFELAIIQESTILLALNLKEQYNFSWYDGLIVATALENDCTHLFSEDMQHGLLVEKRLAIHNPFVP
ncbi:MAG: PIN domain-containing protein [Bacteroidetes bacterium]|nr:PIN domain-containing protein [Bacteroidota bacterium]